MEKGKEAVYIGPIKLCCLFKLPLTTSNISLWLHTAKIKLTFAKRLTSFIAGHRPRFLIALSLRFVRQSVVEGEIKVRGGEGGGTT